MFTMEIPIEDFPTTPTVTSISYDSEDADNLIRVDMRIGMEVKQEGAINLNFTTVKNL